MNWLRNLKVGTRLAGALGGVALLLLVIVAVAWWQMAQMQASSRETTTHWLPSVDRVNRLNTAAAQIRVQEYAHLVNVDVKAKAEVDAQLDKVSAQFETHRQAYAKLLSNNSERQLFQTFEAQWKQYLATGDQIRQHSGKYETDQASGLMVGESRARFVAASATLEQLVDLNVKGAEAESARSDLAFRNARLAMLLSAVVGVGLLVGLSVTLNRSITGPLAEAVRVTQAVAAGDLGSRIVVSSRDETGQLLGALKGMNESLVRIVGLVRNSSDAIATGSAQIATGNADLSQRTEEQASALQQTAATMEQLGSTVKHNADNARQADTLAKGASEVAERGGRVVGQVVDTMKGINDASKRIADIISVIDGIAFQTNILALNAAVEAARAGEQGRGFAVVASEVRSLAQRSAEAAKEIKTLINTSVERVARGTALADTAGSTMAEIVNSIKRVTDIVEEIASASVQQSAGVSQVGEAVAQMDQVTQQNAALVEESAAAAESLKQQAQALVQAVAVFRV